MVRSLPPEGTTVLTLVCVISCCDITVMKSWAINYTFNTSSLMVDRVLLGNALLLKKEEGKKKNKKYVSHLNLIILKPQ